MNPIKTLMARLRREEGGAILTELALSMPIFMLFLSGLIETGNYMMLNLKLQHTVVAVSDLITRDEQISEATITDILSAVPQIMAPYDTSSSTTTIVTAVSQTAAVPATVYWQRSAGMLAVTSEFGGEGDPAILPVGLPLRDDETILASEIFYSYEPLIFPFLSATTIRKVSYFRPRIGALQEILP